MFAVATFVTVVGVLALTVLRRFEDKDPRTMQRRRIDLVLEEEASAANISAKLREMGLIVAIVAQERKAEKKTQSLTLEVRVPAEVDFESLVGSLGADPGVRRVRVERVT